MAIQQALLQNHCREKKHETAYDYLCEAGEAKRSGGLVKERKCRKKTPLNGKREKNSKRKTDK